MEPMDDPELSKLLHEWKVEDAPRSLDERILGARKPWWKLLFTGSLRVPVPVALACAILLLTMGAALLRPRAVAPPASPAVSSTLDLADFQPVRDVQVRIMRSKP